MDKIEARAIVKRISWIIIFLRLIFGFEKNRVRKRKEEAEGKREGERGYRKNIE